MRYFPKWKMWVVTRRKNNCQAQSGVQQRSKAVALSPDGQQLLCLVMAPLLPICRATASTLNLLQKCSEAGLRFPDWKSNLDKAHRQMMLENVKKIIFKDFGRSLKAFIFSFFSPPLWPQLTSAGQLKSLVTNLMCMQTSACYTQISIFLFAFIQMIMQYLYSATVLFPLVLEFIFLSLHEALPCSLYGDLVFH